MELALAYNGAWFFNLLVIVIPQYRDRRAGYVTNARWVGTPLPEESSTLASYSLQMAGDRRTGFAARLTTSIETVCNAAT